MWVAVFFSYSLYNREGEQGVADGAWTDYEGVQVIRCSLLVFLVRLYFSILMALDIPLFQREINLPGQGSIISGNALQKSIYYSK